MTDPTTSTAPKGAPLLTLEDISKIIEDAFDQTRLHEADTRKKVEAIFKRPQDFKLVAAGLSSRWRNRHPPKSNLIRSKTK